MSLSFACSKKAMTWSRVTVGNPGEKIVDRFTTFEIVQQRLHGHAGPGEHRSATHDVGATGHNRLLHAGETTAKATAAAMQPVHAQIALPFRLRETISSA